MEPLDVLVVGGGPAGTAAAFRARELGLEALVIESDDLLRRIRDYSKDKLILPDFGGGDRMRFPAGADCIACLMFEPIDKDEMCSSWRDLYARFEVKAHVGIELTGLEREGDAWTARTWNYRLGEAGSYRARHVVLALGRGVPRRFDVAGNTDGISWRLDDPARYVDGPACVIGGGTSAAEAVIAISNVKAAAGDASPVCWSYRGLKMPRVSKALADEFFEAYVGNGNIRYHPYSEPVAIVTGPDRVEYLSVRVDRTPRPDRPVETLHLEFRKEQCVACIGEDIPEKLLVSLGVDVVALAGKDKKMMAVSRLLETRQPNVYLIGDLLTQAYLEVDDFAEPPESFRSVKHRGNIKSALRDGVFVAEVIRQKIDGRTEIDVTVADADVPSVDRLQHEVEELLGVIPKDVEGAAPATPVEEAPAQEGAYLVRTNLAGVQAEEYRLQRNGVATVGASGCEITLFADPNIEPLHASIVGRDGGFFIRDEGSRSGTHLRPPPGRAVPVTQGSVIRLGRQILVVGQSDRGFEVRHFDGKGREVGRHPVERTIVFGRSGGPRDPDVILAPDDLTLSRFHMALELDGKTLTVQDFGSRNGTYVKVDGEMQLMQGDLVRVGSQLLELRLGDREVQPSSTPAAAQSTAVEAPPAQRKAAATPGALQPSVTFAAQSISGPIEPTETLLQWADARDVAIDSECWIGKCGCDVVCIVQGSEHLSEITDTERKTLKRRGLEAGPYRLACMTKVRGPVVVDTVE